jgi:transcriptional regulator with XRE-family HTH domain
MVILQIEPCRLLLGGPPWTLGAVWPAVPSDRDRWQRDYPDWVYAAGSRLGAGRPGDRRWEPLTPHGADGAAPVSARRLFGSEVRRLRQLRGMSQEQLAGLVMHSRTLVALVELGERWPPQDLAVSCNRVLGGDGGLVRLWPLVDAERHAARKVLEETRLSDLRAVVLRLAVLTGIDPGRADSEGNR